MVITEKNNALKTDKQTIEMAEQRFSLAAWLCEGARWLLLFPVLRVFVPLKVYGAENLDDDGPYIFAANHASHLDAPIMLRALPLRLRLRLRVAAAADYFFTNRLKGTVVRVFINAFPFERKGPGCAESLAHTVQLLEAGHSILLFPEGTRTPDGQMQPFKRGIGRLAIATGVRVVPVWIDGTHDAFPKGARHPQKHPVSVHFGAPLQFAHENDVAEVVSEIEQQVRMFSQKQW